MCIRDSLFYAREDLHGTCPFLVHERYRRTRQNASTKNERSLYFCLTCDTSPGILIAMSMIYLIRHGQASFGHDNYDKLSTLGVRQSRILARHLFDTGFRPDAVYSGAMDRQTATAEEVRSFFAEHGRPLPDLERVSGFDEYDTTAIVTAMFLSLIHI